MAESPDSPLSSLSSEDIADDIASPLTVTRPSVDVWPSADESAPPSKRRKTGPASASHTVFNVHDRAIGFQEYDEDETLSEDTEGSAPGSPTHDEYAVKADQITACQWQPCDAGDLGNSDDLVKHVQEAHVNPKRAKYTCNWGDCARKGSVHPSGYALRAHMRSHTKEKPYFCALPGKFLLPYKYADESDCPECDRAFTRSDALAKHLRTVHEPEPTKVAADATPGPPKKGGVKLRLAKTPNATLPSSTGSITGTTAAQNPHNAGLDPSHPEYDPSPPNENIQYIPAHHPITGQPGFMITYPPDIHFTQFESEIPADQLMRLLRRQIHWAQQDATTLQSAIDELEQLKAKEWLQKELLLEDVMRKEIELGLARGALTEGQDAGRFRDDIGSILEDLAQTPEQPIEVKRANKGLAPDTVPKLQAAEKRSRHSDEDERPKRQEDDMMAVGALLGLSGR